MQLGNFVSCIAQVHEFLPLVFPYMSVFFGTGIYISETKCVFISNVFEEVPTVICVLFAKNIMVFKVKKKNLFLLPREASL